MPTLQPSSWGHDMNPNALLQAAAGTSPYVDDPLKLARDIIETAIVATKTDPGAPFEDDVVNALREVKEVKRADYYRYRYKFKKANIGVLITQLDDAVKGGGDGGESESATDVIIAIAKDRGELFHDKDGSCFVSFDQDDHVETWSLLSNGFRDWISYLCYTELGWSPRENNLKDAIGTLSGIAKFDGEEREVFLRVATHEGNLYIDLCNDNWDVVKVTAMGRVVVDNPPVRFRRTKSMGSLPIPKAGGDVDLLWNSVNIPEEDRGILLAWMLECMRPDTPFPVLELNGVQGSAKSDTQDKIRDLIDPNNINLRTAPKAIDDIFVGAGSNWLVSLNNLSHLSAGMQDAFCTLSTGGGFAKRELYTDFDECSVEVCRPVVYNGIPALGIAQDLVDRTIRLELPTITKRRKSSELKEEFEKNRQSIFSGLLDTFSKTLAEIPNVNIEDLPRMADFAVLGEALYKVLGHPPGTFSQDYKNRSDRAIINALEASPVAKAVQEYITNRNEPYKGTVKQLLTELERYKTGDAWPKSPKGLADNLRRNAPGLRVVGISVVFDTQRRMNGVNVTIERHTLFSEDIISGSEVHEVHEVHNTCKNNELDDEREAFIL